MRSIERQREVERNRDAREARRIKRDEVRNLLLKAEGEPTAEERKLIQSWLQGKSRAKAAKEAGLSSKEAWGKYGVINRPRVRSLLTDAFQQAGLSIDDFARVIKDGFAAVKRQYSKDGDLIDEQPDHQIRYGAYDRGVAALGLVPKEVDVQDAGKQQGLTVHFHLQQPQQASIDAVIEQSSAEPINVSFAAIDKS